MENDKEKLSFLLTKLEDLARKHQDFEREINNLKQEIRHLQSPNDEPFLLPSKPLQQKSEVIFPPKNTGFKSENTSLPRTSFPKFNPASLQKSDFEKFIGENLISKIGILILVIGVGIGSKLAIDKGLINPITRIILGYFVGASLMAVALKLKEKYENFSAVLLSGSIAILYFITYAAYDYYGKIPQIVAFVLMVIFTVFTIIASLKYNKQVIAHIGLVGAYAVPFLLSDGSGKVMVLFSYVTIINIGILILSFKKHWKPIFYSSFALTWLIVVAWITMDYDKGKGHLQIAFSFSTLFFILFYITNLSYKVTKAEIFKLSDVVIILLNSFIFYSVGFFLLDDFQAEQYKGLFTLANAIIHFVVCVIIYKRKLADQNVFYFILAMVITFVTMAAPVQLNGNWVTLFWAVEACALYSIGRLKNISIYERLAFPLVFLAFFSLVHDWIFTFSEFGYQTETMLITPFANVYFLSSCIFIVAFISMFIAGLKGSEKHPDVKISSLGKMLTYIIPTILIMVIYYTFRIEIGHVFQHFYESEKINVTPRTKTPYFEYNPNYILLKKAAIYIYTLFFAAALTIFNLRKLKSETMAVANVAINLVVIASFLTDGLLNLSMLREAYLTQTSKFFIIGGFNIGVRYISIAFFALLMITCYQLSKSVLFKAKIKSAFDYLLYISILWLLSSELLHILEMFGLRTGYKLGLSILWGTYALFLIGIGLWKEKKSVRIGAIALFGITLIKLFFYDIASLDTISKTIVFVSLGILLLIISFLYNKYKHLTNDEH